MKKEEFWNHPLGEPPVYLPDGSIGLLTISPRDTPESVLCGIQVPGELEHRWYHHNKIKLVASGALIAEGEGVKK